MATTLARSLDRGCGSKRAYPSKKVAEGAARIHARDLGGLRRIDAYKCRTCGRWHIGHAQLSRHAPILMSHEDRRRLIEAPIAFAVMGTHSWGGVAHYPNIPPTGRRIPRRIDPDYDDAYAY